MENISCLKIQSSATNRLFNQLVTENQLTHSFSLKYGAKWTLEDFEKLSKIAPQSSQCLRINIKNTDYDNENEEHQDSVKKAKKMDKESSLLPDIDRDTEQAVQDIAIWVFDKETDQSYE